MVDARFARALSIRLLAQRIISDRSSKHDLPEMCIILQLATVPKERNSSSWQAEVVSGRISLVTQSEFLPPALAEARRNRAR
jgi:hypothetical protein